MFEDLSMIILAGGLSSRMGTEKADLNFQGRTFLERQIEKGRQIGIEDILVSGYRGEHCSARVVPDELRQRGPLGGLETCLRAAKHPWCLAVSVDVPLVRVEQLRDLIEYARSVTDGFADVCALSTEESMAGTPGSAVQKDVRGGKAVSAVILQHKNKQEPLLGLYAAYLADAMRQALLKGKGSVFAFLRSQGYAVYQSDGEEIQFSNINSVSDYERICSFQWN